ncbi:MAG: hypothetical protein J6Y42_01390 [Bacilli bacterium]|nr:hypothetical protein [Bacilli bacterium]
MKKIIIIFFVLASIFSLCACEKGQSANTVNKHEHEYENGICKICGFMCSHSTIINDECSECHMIFNTKCKHQFSEGKCVRCGFVCNHEGCSCGDTCSVCNFHLEHQYEGGICTVCGKQRSLEASKIPDQFLTKVANKGTVEKVVFESYDYINSRPFENTFFVYLPYGYYDSDEEYNVMYLLHGSGENAAYWLAQLSYQGGYTETTKVVLDSLHYYGVCEKTIVVTPTENLNGTKKFYEELVKNIMPLAETKYRTKAHLYGKEVIEVKEEDFIASRDYRAYAGLSRGSMIGWSIMAYDLPYFSYYGFYSGGTYGLDYLYTDLVNTLTDKNNNYDIKYSYNSCGDKDAMYSNHYNDYNYFIRYSKGKLVDDENCIFLVKPGFAHNYQSWIIDLYNSLGYCFFKYNGE